MTAMRCFVSLTTDYLRFLLEHSKAICLLQSDADSARFSAVKTLQSIAGKSGIIHGQLVRLSPCQDTPYHSIDGSQLKRSRESRDQLIDSQFDADALVPCAALLCCVLIASECQSTPLLV